MILKQLQNDLLTICICLNYGGVKVACYVVGVRHWFSDCSACSRMLQAYHQSYFRCRI